MAAAHRTAKGRAGPPLTILEAMGDPRLFAPWFQRGDWTAWRAFLAALFALPMGERERSIFHECTGRQNEPLTGFSEAWAICGRRGGKSFITALVGAFLAAFCDYTPYLQPGERAMVLTLACDRRQARIIKRYVDALFAECPMLAALVERQTEETLDLRNRVSVEIATASIRATRGYTIAAVLADETAFWRSEESANPDAEILNALRPGMATIPGARMICIGSPYARRGEMWRAYSRYHGKDDAPVLVWRAPSRTMNPNLPQSVVDAALARDEPAARAEYLAEFRADVESFITREVVEACIRPAPLELPPVSSVEYHAFTDPSGGSADAMTLAVGHTEGAGTTRRFIVDCIRERRPPFSPESVVEDFAGVLKSYGVSRVVGDRYAGEWPRERFREHGIRYDPSAAPKSDLYRDALPALNGQRAELPPSDRLVNQLIGLERRTARGGKDSIDHAPGAHDDLCNAVAGLLAVLAKPHVKFEIFTLEELARLGQAEPEPRSFYLNGSTYEKEV